MMQSSFCLNTFKKDTVSFLFWEVNYILKKMRSQMLLLLKSLSYLKIPKKCLSIYFFLLFIPSGIYAQSATRSTTETDSIQILAIHHTQPSEADHSRMIRVDIVYHLVSKPKGQLMIGFDINETGKFRMLGEIVQIVESGIGQHTFQTSLTEEEWAGDKPFNVYVNLSEFPHPKKWTPLANDREALLLKP
jgi:hypothetical protein